MALVWDSDPLGILGPEAACMHCGRGIWLRPWGWADADGLVVCVKAPAEQIVSGQVPNYVVHQPMPAGLRGSPLTRLVTIWLRLRMLHATLARFGDPEMADQVAGILAELRDSIIYYLDYQELPDGVRLGGIIAAVDELAPAPAPGDERFEVPGGADGPAGELCELIIAIRRIYMAGSLASPRVRLAEIRQLLAGELLLT
jgi:hypothetical protein